MYSLSVSNSQDLAKSTEVKMNLVGITSTLMPNGNPDFKSLVKYQAIKSLIPQVGKKAIRRQLFSLIYDFCKAVNVVRNMTNDQMIEAAQMLLDECEDFRMEDYVIMFSMGKRGQLVDIRDRIDINIISMMLDRYYIVRREEAKKHFEAEERLHNMLPKTPETEQEKEMSERFGQLVGWMGANLEDVPEDNTPKNPLGTRLRNQQMKPEHKEAYERIRKEQAANKVDRKTFIRSLEKGVQISWMKHTENRIKEEGRPARYVAAGVSCTGTIQQRKDDGIMVTGQTLQGKYVEDWLSVNDHTIKIIKPN